MIKDKITLKFEHSAGSTEVSFERTDIILNEEFYEFLKGALIVAGWSPKLVEEFFNEEPECKQVYSDET